MKIRFFPSILFLNAAILRLRLFFRGNCEILIASGYLKLTLKSIFGIINSSGGLY